MENEMETTIYTGLCMTLSAPCIETPRSLSPNRRLSTAQPCEAKYPEGHKNQETCSPESWQILGLQESDLQKNNLGKKSRAD